MKIKDMAVSSGSACTSASLEPSYVLQAMGVGDDLAHSSIRFSLGRFTTAEEIDYAVDQVVSAVKELRELSPLYEMAQEGVDLQGRAVEAATRKGIEPWHTATKSSTTSTTRGTSGRWTRTRADVGTGIVGAPECGDVMKLQIQVDDERHDHRRQVQDLRLRVGHRRPARWPPSGSRAGRSTRPLELKNTDIAQELSCRR